MDPSTKVPHLHRSRFWGSVVSPSLLYPFSSVSQIPPGTYSTILNPELGLFLPLVYLPTRLLLTLEPKVPYGDRNPPLIYHLPGPTCVPPVRPPKTLSRPSPPKLSRPPTVDSNGQNHWTRRHCVVMFDPPNFVIFTWECQNLRPSNFTSTTVPHGGGFWDPSLRRNGERRRHRGPLRTAGR